MFVSEQIEHTRKTFGKPRNTQRTPGESIRFEGDEYVDMIPIDIYSYIGIYKQRGPSFRQETIQHAKYL